MTPIYEIKANQTDITEIIKAHFISLSLSDSIGLSSDSLTLVLDDKDHAIAWPKKGVPLNLKLGFNHELVEKGLFTVNEVEHSGDPDTLTIHCVAADLSKMSAMKVTKHWENYTLGAVCEEIARKYQIEVFLSQEAKLIPVAHAYQIDETDINFLKRLAEAHQALIQVKNGKLILYKISNINDGFFIADESAVNQDLLTVKRYAKYGYYWRYYYYSYYRNTVQARTFKQACLILARRYALTLNFDRSISTYFYYETQNKETDFVFFNRMAKRYKINMLIENGVLSVRKAGKNISKTASGKALSSVTIERYEVDVPAYSERSDNEYQGAKASYKLKRCYNWWGGRQYCYYRWGGVLTVGSTKSTDKIKDLGRFNSKEEAEQALEKFQQRAIRTLRLPLKAGRVDINVGMDVELKGDFKARILEQKWTVKKVDNALQDGLSTTLDLVTQVDFKKLEEEQEK